MFNLLLSFIFIFFTHFVQDVRKHVLLPVMKENKLNPETIYLWKDRGQYYYPSTMAKSLRIKSKDRRNCCYVITLG